MVTIIARFFSSLMMHLNVEPDIRNGLELMKYAVNHPSKFRNYDKGLFGSNFLPGFFVGFAQAIIALIVEFMVIFYLSSLTNLMDIIMKFVTMAAIVKFDDMYAASLYENKIRKAAGKKLKVEYKRYMQFESKPEGTPDDDFPWQENPRAGSFILQLLRGIYKSLRILYVSFDYYFFSFTAIAVTFTKNYQVSHE